MQKKPGGRKIRINNRPGETALITGAAKRIGRAIALALADIGMNVVVHYNRSSADAFDLVAHIKKKGVCAWAIAGDFSSDSGCAALINEAATAAGKSLMVLVNNASIYPENTLAGMTFDHLSRCVRVNAWAPFYLSRAFAARVKRGRTGSVVNILDNRTSGGGRDRSHAAYLISKQILASITRLCALEFSPAVRVNGVAPGLILPPPGKNRDYLDKLKESAPLRTFGAPSDIAAAVVFCVRSPFLTGEIITVDGGRHLL
jgi:pteridine reductase